MNYFEQKAEIWRQYRHGMRSYSCALRGIREVIQEKLKESGITL